MGRVRRKYDYTGIPNTPFTVVVSLPEHEHIGNYRVHATEEIHRSHVSGTFVKCISIITKIMFLSCILVIPHVKDKSR